MFQIGNLVSRIIDDEWFPAKIEKIDSSCGQETYYSIRYIDDDKVEEMVPFDEIRECKESPRLKEKYYNLKKPLAGLVDDDSEERSTHVPTIIIHDVLESGDILFKMIYYYPF